MKKLLILIGLILLIFILVGCSITQRYNEYSVRVNTEDGSTYDEYFVNTRIRVSSNRKYVSIKYPDHKVKYNVSEYHYMYPRFKIFKRKKDRTGIVLETTNGMIIKIYYTYSYTTVDVPKKCNYDLTDSLITFDNVYGSE